jgi:hypothetical protein
MSTPRQSRHQQTAGLKVAKRKSRAVIAVADGAGGMMEVKDRRFERTDWPVRFQVPAGEQADTWISHLVAECRKRDWIRAGSRKLTDRKTAEL